MYNKLFFSLRLFWFRKFMLISNLFLFLATAVQCHVYYSFYNEIFFTYVTYTSPIVFESFFNVLESTVDLLLTEI